MLGLLLQLVGLPLRFVGLCAFGCHAHSLPQARPDSQPGRLHTEPNSGRDWRLTFAFAGQYLRERYSRHRGTTCAD
jgi:hypothetical protein